MKIILKKKNGVADYKNLVGCESGILDMTTTIYDWDSNHNDLGIIIRNKTGLQTGVERVSLGFGEDIFLQKMTGFGFEIEVSEELSYSFETIQKAKGLQMAGFIKLIRVDSDYYVDGNFKQNILLDSELAELLENETIEVNLSDII